MEKMKLTGYSDKEFTEEIASMVVQLVPKDYRGKKGIKYESGKENGQNVQSPVFTGQQNEELSLDFTFDCTGTIEGTKDSDTIDKKLKELNRIVYAYNGDKHEPAYVQIVWGTFIFRGRLKEMTTDFVLFTPQGVPLRAKVNLSFIQFVSAEKAVKLANNQSPDMSHLVTLRDGDTIALLCRKIYGDSTLVNEVAAINGLCGFRLVKPGTTLLFPHLRKNG